MLKILRLIIVFIILAVPAIAQEAESLFDEGRYAEALPLYQQQLKARPNDGVLLVKTARCLMGLARYEEAIPLLERAVQRKAAKANYYMYEACFATYRFEKAANALSLYLDVMDDRAENYQQLKEQLLKAQMGASMLERVEDIAIIDSVKIDKAHLLDIYRLQKDLGRLDYFTEIVGVKTPEQMVAYYSGRNDRMYFSDFGNGDLNLMLSYRLLGGWSDAVSLSDIINTDYDENYPFVLPDGVTIYFASKGHNSLGGYDIFMSRYNSATEEYTQPINIGMPFNSPANDYLLVIDEMSQVGWFATDRNQQGDTVVVYEFIPNQTKVLIDPLEHDDADYVRLAAQLRRYRQASYREMVEEGEAAEENRSTKKVGINFVVCDDVVYHSVSQFKSEDAKALYLKVDETQKRLNTTLILLEGKRREYVFVTAQEDRSNLKVEIMEMEREILHLNELLEEYSLQTRRAEMKALER